MRAHYEALGLRRARPRRRLRHRRPGRHPHPLQAGAPTSGRRTERGAAYVGVDDADALHAEWRAAAVGETSDLFDPGFGVWEAAHTDDDGNLLRFGSPLAALRALTPAPPDGRITLTW